MWDSLKFVLLFAVVAGFGYGAVQYPDVLLDAYERINPPPVDEELPPLPEPTPIPKAETAVTKDAKPFEVGSIMYIAGRRDVYGWGEPEVPMYATWDGSEDKDLQTEIDMIDHGTQVLIIKKEYYRGEGWYRVETQGQFRKRGWVTGNFLKSYAPGPVNDTKEWGKPKKEDERKQTLVDPE